MDSITTWDNDDTRLITEMDKFEEGWVHKNPCKQYKKIGYCKHLEQAQKRKFAIRVRAHVSTLKDGYPLEAEPKPHIQIAPFEPIDDKT